MISEKGQWQTKQRLVNISSNMQIKKISFIIFLFSLRRGDKKVVKIKIN